MLDRLFVGKLLKPNGLSGEVGIYPYGDDPERFYKLNSCALVTESGETVREVKVRKACLRSGRVYLSFEGVNTREEAARLTGLLVSVPRSEAAPLPPNSWYAADLIACSVYDQTGFYLGLVNEVLDTGTQSVLKVDDPPKPVVYIPFVPQFLVSVDPMHQKIVVSPPEGLIDLYRG